MQFFLYEVVARIVAAYLCYDCYRDLRVGLIDRKIEYVHRSDLVNWVVDLFTDPAKQIAHRDTQPIQYGIQIVFHVGPDAVHARRRGYSDAVSSGHVSFHCAPQAFPAQAPQQQQRSAEMTRQSNRGHGKPAVDESFLPRCRCSAPRR